MNFDDDIKQMPICFQAKLQMQRLREHTRKEQVRRNAFNQHCEVHSGGDAPEINIPTKDDNIEATPPANDVIVPSEKSLFFWDEKNVSKVEKSNNDNTLFSILFNDYPTGPGQSIPDAIEDKLMALMDSGSIPFTESGGVLPSDVADAFNAIGDNVITVEAVRLILRQHGWRPAKAPRSDSLKRKQLRVWYPPFNNLK